MPWQRRCWSGATPEGRRPSTAGVDEVSPGDVPADAEDGHGWVIRVWLLVVAFVAVMLARSSAVGIAPRDPHGAIFVRRVAVSLAILVVLAVLDAVVRAGRGGGGRR